MLRFIYKLVEDFTIQKVAAIITRLACWATGIIIPVIVIFLIYYGLRMALSHGDPSKFNEAKKGLLYAILGIIVILGSYTIIATVGYNISGGKFNFPGLGCGPIEDVRTNFGGKEILPPDLQE